MLKIEILIDESHMKELIAAWWAESVGPVPMDQIKDVGPEDVYLLLGTENCKVKVEMV
jgi:ArsR family metal-binding transcriptional regulator